MSGTGFDPEETVSITYNDELVTDVTADEEGAFQEAAFNVPDDAEPGDYEINATGEDSGVSGAKSLTVF